MRITTLLFTFCLLAMARPAFSAAMMYPPADSTKHLEIRDISTLEALVNASGVVAGHNDYHFDEVDNILEMNRLEREHAWGGAENDAMSDLDQIAVDYKGNPKVQHAFDVYNAITESKLLDKLTGDKLVELPVGIRKIFGSTTTTLMLAKAKIKPSYTQFEVICIVELSNDRVLAFGSDDIKYSNEGGFIGDLTLGLYADYAFKKGSPNIYLSLNKFEKVNGDNDKGCYVKFDCNGFIEMRIDGTVHLSRNWVTPADINGKPMEGEGRVKADISVLATDFNDMIITVTLPDFVLTKVPDVAFILTGAVIDFSDKRHADGFVLPPQPSFEPSEGGNAVQTTSAMSATTDDGEGSPNQPPAPDTNAINMWKGIFIKNIQIIFPEVLKYKNGDRLTAGAERLYIDSRGVAGTFYIGNPLPLGMGKMRSWDYSIDRLDMTAAYGKIYVFSMRGRIDLPVTPQDQPLMYYAYANVEKKQYGFRADVTDETKFPFIKAGKVNLLPSSFIRVQVNRDTFDAMASLTGSLSISTSEEGGGSLQLPFASFTKLLVLAGKPFLSLDNQGGSFTLDTLPILNNSRINVGSASIVKTTDTTSMLVMEMSANLMDEGGGAKTGGTFGIKGKMVQEGDNKKWKYDGLKLMALSVDITIGSQVHISGSIQTFNNHPVYGNGFKGSLSGGFIAVKEEGTGGNGNPGGSGGNSNPGGTGGNGNPGGSGGNSNAPKYKFNLAANMIFGSKPVENGDPYKYWFFDAFVSSDTWAVPLFAGIEANGFGGGAYHHMKMDGFAPTTAPDSANLQNPSSGIVYKPDPSVALGLKASMAIRSTDGGAFKGVVTLEMVFGAGMSLQQVMFYGKGEMTTDLKIPDIKDRLNKLKLVTDEAKESDKADANADKQDKISAAFYIQANFEDGFILQGTFKAYLDAGKGKVTGQGQIDLLINPKVGKWHLYLGGYSDLSVVDVEGNKIPPVQASINFGAFALEANFYLLTGNDIPGAPPIDPRVATFFGIPQNSNNRSILAAGGRSPATGTGFAMGASVFFDIHVQDGQCGWVKKKDVYFKVDGGAGFDISLLKYGDNTSCSESGTADHGLKRWRAGGRIWSYVNLKEGRGKVLGACVNIPHFQFGFLLDADVPNPSVFQAYLKFSIVGINVNLKPDPIGTACGIVVENGPGGGN